MPRISSASIGRRQRTLFSNTWFQKHECHTSVAQALEEASALSSKTRGFKSVNAAHK
jgi:hypothetical protein